MRYLISALMLALLTACATPYQPFEWLGRGGYTDQALGADRYQINYYTNMATGPGTRHALLMYRTAEVALANGYKRFAFVHVISRVGGRGFQSEEATVQMSRVSEPSPAGKPWFFAAQVLNDYGSNIK